MTASLESNILLEKRAVASEHHGDNETQEIKLMEFHIKAVDEDAAGSNQVDIAVSRPSSQAVDRKGKKVSSRIDTGEKKQSNDKIPEKGLSNR